MKFNENKFMKMKEAFGGFEFGLTEMCPHYPSMGHKYKLKVILRQH